MLAQGFQPITDGGTAWILFSVMVIGIYIVLRLTITK